MSCILLASAMSSKLTTDSSSSIKRLRVQSSSPQDPVTSPPTSSDHEETHCGTSSDRQADCESLASSTSLRRSVAASSTAHVLSVATGRGKTMQRRPLIVDTAEVGVGAAPSNSCESVPSSAVSSPTFSFLRKNSNTYANQDSTLKMTKPSWRKQRRSRSVGDKPSWNGVDQVVEYERPASRCSLPDAALRVDTSSNQYQSLSGNCSDVSLLQNDERYGSRTRRSFGRRSRSREKEECEDNGRGNSVKRRAAAVGRKRELVKSMMRGRRDNKSSKPTNDDGSIAQPTLKGPISESISGADFQSVAKDSPKVSTEVPAPPEEEVASESQVPSFEAVSVDNSTKNDIDDTGDNPLISILHHSFIESCMPSCGNYGQIVQSPTELTHDEEARLEHRLEDIEDPTVQESIECVFAHQLDDGLEGFFDDANDGDSQESIERERDTNAFQADEGQRIPSPFSSRANSFRFLDSANSTSRTSSIGSASTKSTKDFRSSSSQRNSLAVASILKVPHPLVHSTSSDAELVAAARRTASEPDGLGLPPRPLSATATAARTKAFSAGLPPKPTLIRGTTTGSLRRIADGGDDHAAHELRRRTWSRRVLDSKRLVFIGTIGREGSLADAALSEEVEEVVAQRHCAQPQPASSECTSCRGRATNLPHAPPHLWPQAPLLLRPTPGNGTKIRGIRYSGSNEYIWKTSQGDHNHTDGPEMIACWSEYLKNSWKQRSSNDARRLPVCAECAPIPVNNGNEAPGQSLVVDFESDIFIGTLLLRIKNSRGTTPKPYDDSSGYFTGMNRRYQTVVRGMFKKDGVAMTDCVTGQVLNRKCGKLPPKMILRGAVKIISYFAPQLKVKLDAEKPYCISPLGSTPQVMKLKRENGFNAEYQADQSIEENQEEPEDMSSSLLSLMGCQQSSAPTSVARAKARKKAFDKLYAENDKSLVFDRSTEYSFEFLQHLIDFDDFGVDLGNMVGKVLLKELLDGQPLKFMAARRKNSTFTNGKSESLDLEYIWSFDIFHEAVYEDCRDE